jgi:hypothetical protein
MMLSCVMCLVMALSTAQAALNIDFGRPDGPVQADFEGFFGEHENALQLYTPQSFSAFGTTVTLSLSWNPHVPKWASMQMIDRGGNDGTDTPDLLRDWTGTDGRQYGDPLTLTISGLPAGEYEWLSYHHDPEDQTGIFDVTVNDAAGSATTTGIDISSTRNDAIVAIADVTKFTTDILSDGSDVSLTFSVVFGPEAATAEKFFVMNAFELVPEPATIALLGLGSLALIRRRRS